MTANEPWHNLTNTNNTPQIQLEKLIKYYSIKRFKEQWLLLENNSWKINFKPRVVWQKKRIKITCDQEFDEIEDRRKNERKKRHEKI